MPRSNKAGFTLVELLIVIVVVAILSSITVVAYRGVRERAVTAAYSSAVDQWEKILNAEIALTGEIPATDNNGICLGRGLADFPAEPGFGAGRCIEGLSTEASDTYFNSFQFKTTLPQGLLPVATLSVDGGGSMRGRGVVLDSHIPQPGDILISKFYSLSWYPQYAGQCGRGESWGPLFGIEPGSLTGDVCILYNFYGTI